jgi:myosin heavy subunit
VFKEEERVFISEGLAEWCSQIKFTDNTPVIEVLEKAPIGIFNLLDESCTIASNTDDHLLQNIRKQHKANALLVNPKMPTNPTFTLIHTAKDVEYNVNGFRAKNRDETSVILLDAMSVSHSELVADLFVKSDIKSDKFLGTKIRKEMSELMKELNSCDVHFIRCIKPNEVKKCNIFHQSMTLN